MDDLQEHLSAFLEGRIAAKDLYASLAADEAAVPDIADEYWERLSGRVWSLLHQYYVEQQDELSLRAGIARVVSNPAVSWAGEARTTATITSTALHLSGSARVPAWGYQPGVLQLRAG
jgi:hypothetical protein